MGLNLFYQVLSETLKKGSRPPYLRSTELDRIAFAASSAVVSLLGGQLLASALLTDDCFGYSVLAAKAYSQQI